MKKQRKMHRIPPTDTRKQKTLVEANAEVVEAAAAKEPNLTCIFIIHKNPASDFFRRPDFRRFPTNAHSSMLFFYFQCIFSEIMLTQVMKCGIIRVNQIRKFTGKEGNYE